MAFYRGLWKILEKHKIVTRRRSTQSVWIIDDEPIAREIHEHAIRYGLDIEARRAHMAARGNALLAAKHTVRARAEFLLRESIPC